MDMKLCPAVFLDRDGTINHDAVYIDTPDRFELYPFAAPAIARLNRLGMRVFLVTNQSGIARGYFSPDDLERIHAKMHAGLAAGGAHLDDVFISPYFKTGIVEPYNIDSPDRKPGLGLFHQARAKWDFPIAHSFMIGDRYSDIAFGKKAGLTTILVLSGLGREEFLDKRDSWQFKPDIIVENIEVASRVIERLLGRTETAPEAKCTA